MWLRSFWIQKSKFALITSFILLPKCHFLNKPYPKFSEIRSFTPKSSWKSPGEHPILAIILSQIENEIFKTCKKALGYSNFSTNEFTITENSHKIFESLKQRDFISERQPKYFRFDFQKVCNLGKMYLMSKIYKRIFNVLVRPVISDCGRSLKMFLNFWRVIFIQSWGVVCFLSKILVISSVK